MAQPATSISISDREAFVEAAKEASQADRRVRIGRTFTTVMMKTGEKWRERPAVRYFYEVNVEKPGDPPQVWTYAEVVPVGEDRRVKGELQSALRDAGVKSELMLSQSGSF